MTSRALLSLPAAPIDLAISKACARNATPGLEQALKVFTGLADEKVVLGGAVLFWFYVRSRKCENVAVREANHLLVCAALAGVLPQILKHVVDRKRPDRVVPHSGRQGI